MKLPKRDAFASYSKIFNDIKMGETKSVLFKEEIGKAKSQMLRSGWEKLAGRELSDGMMKTITAHIINPRPGYELMMDGTIKRKAMENGTGTLTAPIQGSISYEI